MPELPKPEDMPKSYAMLFLGWPGKDWMARVDKYPDGVFGVHHRVRFHNPIPRADDVWDEQDLKVWSHHGPFPTLGDALDTAVLVGLRLVLEFGPPDIADDVVEPTGDQERFVAELEKKPWCFAKTFKTREEADAYLKSKEPS